MVGFLFEAWHSFTHFLVKANENQWTNVSSEKNLVVKVI